MQRPCEATKTKFENDIPVGSTTGGEQVAAQSALLPPPGHVVIVVLLVPVLHNSDNSFLAVVDIELPGGGAVEDLHSREAEGRLDVEQRGGKLR